VGGALVPHEGLRFGEEVFGRARRRPLLGARTAGAFSSRSWRSRSACRPPARWGSVGKARARSSSARAFTGTHVPRASRLEVGASLPDRDVQMDVTARGTATGAHRRRV